MSVFTLKLTTITIISIIASSYAYAEEADPLNFLSVDEASISDGLTEPSSGVVVEILEGPVTGHNRGVVFLGDGSEIILPSDENGIDITKTMSLSTTRAPTKAGWYMINFTKDSAEAFYYNGLKTPSSIHGNNACSSNYTTRYYVQVDAEGSVLANYSTDRWTISYISGNYKYCGTPVFLTRSTNSNNLVPGTYTFSFIQGATKSVITRGMPACLSGKTILDDLYASRHPAATDFFMTTIKIEHDYSLTIGFIPQASVAKVPRFAHGLYSAPFIRYYHRLPITGHFYTTNEAELAYANSAWEKEKIEGYLYTKPFINTVALHRLHKLYPADDVEHFYTASSSEKDAYVRNGWKYDGISGYVCPR